MPGRIYNRAVAIKAQLDVERLAFAKQLRELTNNPRNRIVYLDETSFNVIYRPLKCWQQVEAPIQVQLMSKRPSNVTLYGAISNTIAKPVIHVASSTNGRDFRTFLQLIRARISRRQLRQQRTTIIVLDNHSAHKSEIVRAYIERDQRMTKHRFQLTFQPAYSCEFNSTEQYWSLVKHQYRQIMAKVTRDLSEEQFRAIAVQAAHDLNLSTAQISNLVRANAKFIGSWLQ